MCRIGRVTIREYNGTSTGIDSKFTAGPRVDDGRWHMVTSFCLDHQSLILLLIIIWYCIIHIIYLYMCVSCVLGICNKDRICRINRCNMANIY
jgi:hypothetical protein